MSDEEGVAALARVLAHETCVRLIDALGTGDATVSDLACRLHLEQPRVSTHLALLRDAGLVDCQADGRQRVYRLRGQAPALALATLRTLRATLDPDAEPGAAGAAALAAAGVDLSAGRRTRRAFAIECADWTERRPHLGGALGAALLAALLDGRRARLRPGDRVVELAPGEPARFLEAAGV